MNCMNCKYFKSEYGEGNSCVKIGVKIIDYTACGYYSKNTYEMKNEVSFEDIKRNLPRDLKKRSTESLVNEEKERRLSISSFEKEIGFLYVLVKKEREEIRKLVKERKSREDV